MTKSKNLNQLYLINASRNE